jgi:hypothetical protein
VKLVSQGSCCKIRSFAQKVFGCFISKLKMSEIIKHGMFAVEQSEQRVFSLTHQINIVLQIFAIIIISHFMILVRI